MNVYALFEDGTIAEVIVTLFNSDEISVKLTNQDSKDIKVSAQDGVIAASKIIGNIKKDAYFKLEGKDKNVDFRLTGRSAGLSFAFKFCDEVLQEKGKSRSFSIAATGRVSDQTANATIRGVGGINIKLRTALGVLNKGDKIFYPKENDQEIEPDIRMEAERAQIELIPVSTLKEAVERFLSEIYSDERKKRRKKLLIMLITVVVAILCLRMTVPYVMKMYRDYQYSRVQSYLQRGKFLKAKEIAERYDSEARFAKIRIKLDTAPIYRINCLYYLHTQHNRRSIIPLDEVEGREIIELTSNHNFRFEVEPNGDIYLYIFQIDSHGNPLCLFPNQRYTSQGNPLAAGRVYWIPSNERGFYYKGTGRKRIFIIASFWPAKDLELLLARDNRNSDKFILSLYARNLPEVAASFYRVFTINHRR